MTVRALAVDLGTLETWQYQTGWYRDPVSGDYYYYDATAKQWYVQSAGYLYPLTIAKQDAPKTVSLAPGDTLRITFSYKYTGPAISVTEYASVGVYGDITHIYDEKVHKSHLRSLPESPVPTTYNGSIDIVLPADAKTKWVDIECKVFGSGEELGLRYYAALNVVAVVPEFSEFTITDYVKT